MTATEFASELAYPFTRVAVALPILVSWVLFSLASFFGLFGMFLFLCALFPFYAYLLRLTRARAMKQAAPAFDAELMAFFGDPVSLFPLGVFSCFGWGGVAIMAWSEPLYGWLFIMLSATTVPASLAILAVSRSPLESINPLAIANFIRASVADYWPTVVVLEILAGLIILVYEPANLLELPVLPVVCLLFLTYSLSGAVAGRHAIAELVDIPDPLPLTVEDQQRKSNADRVQVANHAYGFASRGNRAGAFQHIEQHLVDEADPVAARLWFFNQMLHWDNKDTALYFAQDALRHLLMAGEDRLAMKMLSQCLHIRPDFRPNENDRDAILALATRLGRDDLVQALR